MPGIAEVEPSGTGVDEPVPTSSGRHHAIEHVDAARHAFQDIVGSPDPHEVARGVVRKQRRGLFDGAQHDVLGFADRQAADRIAVEADGDQGFGAAAPQRRPRTTLHDPEQRLIRRHSERVFRALGPAQR